MLKVKAMHESQTLRHSCFQYFFEVVETGKGLEKGVMSFSFSSINDFNTIQQNRSNWLCLPQFPHMESTINTSFLYFESLCSKIILIYDYNIYE